MGSHEKDNPGFELEASFPPITGNVKRISFENVDLQDLNVPASSNNNPPVMTMKYKPKETRRMTRNIYVVSFGFLLLFTAYNGMSNVLSSMYPQDGLGTYTNATVYGFLIFSSLLVPTYAIRKFTAKWCLVLAMFGYTFQMVAQYHPEFYTLLPAAALVGICAAPLWASKSFYLTHVGNQYAELVSDNSEIIIIRFFGIFFMLFQSSQIWGNLISSTILSTGQKVIPNETQLEFCGRKFCPGDLFSSDDEIEDDMRRKMNIYAGVCLFCAFLGIGLVAILFDPLTRYGEKERIAAMEKKTVTDLLLATTMHMKNPYQILIIPLTIYSGLEQGFLSTDFTQAFITCSWGVHNVGYVLICYGTVDAILSIAFGPVVRKLGRVPVYTLGALINFAMIATMFLWTPDPDKSYVLFIIAGCWGAADAVWQTQINSLYGVIFPGAEEAAFSNYRLWESLGFIIAYVNGNLVCVNAKLVILVVILTLGMTGFYVIEYKEYSKRKNERNFAPNGNLVSDKL